MNNIFRFILPADIIINCLVLISQGQSNSKVSSLFGGTQDKCVACKKTVYPLEKVLKVAFVEMVN